MAWLLATLLGCGPNCATNENVTAEGTCVPQGVAVGWDEDTLPGHRLRECAMQPGDGSMDLFEGCARGVCRGDAYGTFASTLGQPDSIDASGPWALAEWNAVGMWGWFPDDDDDGQPDGGPPDFITLRERSSGTTSEGLRVGVSIACFVQILGQPSAIDTADGLIETLHFDAHSIRISDYTGDQSFLEPDGYVDSITIDD